MKNNSLFVATLLSGFIFLVSCSPGVVRVNARPAVVVGVRPAAPSPRHIWIADEYRWRNGRYTTIPGYWAHPPRSRYSNYIPGHWKNTRRGVRWVPGHWN